jgi:putative AlgH/UPF0301 family transcriptional regulator
MVRKLRFRVPVLPAAPEHIRVILALYKSLLRTAGRFDRSPCAKALLYRSQRPPTAVNMQTCDGYYAVLLERIFQRGLLFTPDRNSFSFSKLIKAEFRKKNDIPVETKMECAFKGIRKFSSDWGIYEGLVAGRGAAEAGRAADPPPEGRAPVAGIDRVFAGCVLAAHPLLHGPLSRAVILVLQHDNTGSYGVVINHRSDKPLCDVVKNLPHNILNVFSSNPTYYGGPTKRLQSIHNFPNMDGDRIPMASMSDDFQLFTGGVTNNNLEKLSSELAATATATAESDGSAAAYASRDSFHFFTGCCTWNSGEIQRQIAEGYWMPMVLCAEDVWKIIEQAKPPPSSTASISASGSAGAAAGQGGEAGQPVDTAKLTAELTAAADSIAKEQEQEQEVTSPNTSSTSTTTTSASTSTNTEGESSEFFDPDAHMTPGGRVRNRGWAWLMRAAGQPHSQLSSIPFVLDVEDIDALD